MKLTRIEKKIIKLEGEVAELTRQIELMWKFENGGNGYMIGMRSDIISAEGKLARKKKTLELLKEKAEEADADA